MSLTTDAMTPADFAAITNNNDGFGGGNGGWWMILLFLLILGGWNNNGWNNGGANQGAANNYVLASDFATLQRQLSDGFGSMERKGDSISNGLCDGFYAQNTTMLNGFAGVNQSMNTQGFETRNAIQNSQITAMQNANAIQSQLAQCCCDMRAEVSKGFGDVRYDSAMNANNLQNAVNTGFCQTNFNNQNNTRDIIANQDANTRAILDSLMAQRIEAKDAKIAEQAQMISGLQLAASQSAQNQYLINQLKAPCPIPAYTVPNPYCNCNQGCGC